MLLAWQTYYQGQQPFYVSSQVWTWTSATSQVAIAYPILVSTITLSPALLATVDLNGADL